MGIQDVIALAIAATAAVVVLRFTWQSLAGGGGCSCERGDPDEPCTKATVRTGARHKPMVLIENVGGCEPAAQTESEEA